MRRLTIILALLFVVSAVTILNIQAQQQPSDAPIRVQTTLVSVPVIVSDRDGRYISGLKVEDFRLYQDRVAQPVSIFDSVEEPLNVGLLLDTSKSTHGVLDDIKKDAVSFLKELRSQDRALVMCFDFDTHLVSGLTGDRRALERSVKRAEIGERVGTVLRDAVSEVIDHQFKQVDGRKAIILLTDGKDVGSAISEEELLEKAAESGAMIYPVFFETRLGGGFGGRRQSDGWRRRRFPFTQFPRERQGRMERRNESAERFLNELSDTSAGRFFNSKVEDLKKTFSLIAEELRHQYRLGFYPDSSKADGRRHRLSVEVTRPDAVVRARRSYLAAGHPSGS
jgi:VWFA-related protein